MEASVTDSIWVVRLRGEIDMAAAPEIREALRPAVSESSTDVVVDLRKVTFLDSMALGALVNGRNRAIEKGTCVRLVVNGDPVTRLLGLTHSTVCSRFTNPWSMLSRNSRHPARSMATITFARSPSSGEEAGVAPVLQGQERGPSGRTSRLPAGARRKKRAGHQGCGSK